MGGKSRSIPQPLVSAQDMRALELQRQGWRLKDIAQQLGLPNAHQATVDALSRARDEEMRLVWFNLTTHWHGRNP